MPDKVKSELDKMNKDFEKATGMRVIQNTPPEQGKTEFAKDKKIKDGQP